MTGNTISDAIGKISAVYIEEAADDIAAKKSRTSAMRKWAAAAACLCMLLAAIPVMLHRSAPTDCEPYQALTEAETMAYRPFGALYPEAIPAGYALEENTVGLYDGRVLKAVYCNESTGDVLTITIADNAYFGDVAQNTVLADSSGGTRLYVQSGSYLAAYSSSTRNIAEIKDFDEMVRSAPAFQSAARSRQN